MGRLSVQKVGNPVCQAVCSSNGDSHLDNLHPTVERELGIISISAGMFTLLQVRTL